MQATQAAALPSTCTVMRKAQTPDGMGGFTETWGTLASGVACRLAVMPLMGRSNEDVVAQRWAGQQVWQLTLPAGQDVTHDDRVTIDGIAYDVVGVKSAGAWETARRVILVRVM